MKKIIYNKLVRDKIPEIIKRNSGIPKITILKKKQYIKELFKKLSEETGELTKVKKSNRQELVKEIGDIYEVIDNIIKNCGLNKKDIIKLKRQRKITRGGFDKKIFLESVEK